MTGDQLFVLNDHLFVCKEDYYAGMYPIEENSFSISKQNKVFLTKKTLLLSVDGAIICFYERLL